VAEPGTDLVTDGDGSFQSIVDRHGRQFRTVGDMAYEVIREGILTGVFAPGERLRQDALASLIGVSRIPVRSALMKLESQGLITFEPYRGAVVNTLTPSDAREIYGIRFALEAHALRNAMTAMTPERLERLEGLARELNEVENGEEFLQRRAEFYHELYDVKRQPRLVAMIDRLREEVGRYSIEHNLNYVRPPGERDHAQLLSFLRAGDPDGAVRWLEGHFEHVCERLLTRLAHAGNDAD
jgi:DNA-binding GntR family transcriptional regulator